MNGLRVRKLEKVGLTVTLQTTTPPETDTNKSAQCGKRPRFRVRLNLRVSVRFRVKSMTPHIVAGVPLFHRNQHLLPVIRHEVAQS